MATQSRAKKSTNELRPQKPSESQAPGGSTDSRSHFNPITPAFLRMPEVMRLTSLSRPTLYRRIAARRFPAPIHLGGRASAWSFTALQDWIKDPESYLSE
jgi:predicted DNA-binding transcriptional regulator AlpA